MRPPTCSLVMGFLRDWTHSRKSQRWFLLTYSLIFASFRNSRSAFCTWAAQEVFFRSSSLPV